MSQPLSYKASLLTSLPPNYYTPGRSLGNSQVLKASGGFEPRPNLGLSTKRSPSASNLQSDLIDIQKRYENETQEIQKSYQSNYERHLKFGRTIQELEAMLDDERRKYLLLEDKFQALMREYDSERRLRIDLDHDIASLKEELRRKEAIIQDLDVNLSKQQQDNAYLITEGNTLRSEISRITDVYHYKLNETEERYIAQIRELNAQIEGLRSTIEQQSLENSNQIRELNREWEGKLFRSDDKLRERERTIAELEAELRSLADHNQRLKVEFEEETRRQIASAKDEERTRWQIVIKDLESQIRSLNDERDVLARKNQDLMRDCSIKERQIQDLRVSHEIEGSRLANEISDLRNHISILNSNNEKLRNDLINKEAMLNRLQDENQSIIRELDREREEHQVEMNRLVNEHNNDARRWEDRERDYRNRLAECERALKFSEENENRIRLEYDKLRDQLTGNISRMIAQTFEGTSTATQMRSTSRKTLL